MFNQAHLHHFLLSPLNTLFFVAALLTLFICRFKTPEECFYLVYCLDRSHIDILIRISDFGGVAAPCREGM